MYIKLSTIKKEIQFLERKLERVSSKSKKIKINNSLLSLYDLYELLVNEKCNFKYDNDYEQNIYYYKLIKEYYQKINNMRDYHKAMSKNILKIYKETSFDVFTQNKRHILTKKDFINILYDFFNQYDPKYYKLVKEMIENNQVEITQLNVPYQGICIKISELSKSYAICDIEHFDIFGMMVMVHEFGHAIYNDMVHNKNPQQSFNYAYTNYLEIPSIYFEKLFLNYCLENRICYHDTLFGFNELYESFFQNTLAIRFFTNHIISDIKLDENFSIEYKIMLKIINDIAKELSPNKELLLKFNIRDAFIYSYGFLIATYFIEQYNDNPIYAKKNFRNFLYKLGLVGDKELLNSCGLNINELSNPIVLKKELKTHMNAIKTELKINY